MPLYRLKCNACGEEFQDFRNIDEREEKGPCLSCRSTNVERVEKIVVDCECGCGCSGVKASRD